jgi:subtilisin family serine protease
VKTATRSKSMKRRGARWLWWVAVIPLALLLCALPAATAPGGQPQIPEPSTKQGKARKGKGGGAGRSPRPSADALPSRWRVPRWLPLPQYPELERGLVKRGGDAKEKLSPELNILFDQFDNSRGRFRFGEEQLRDLFNLTGSDDSNPSVAVTVRVSDPAQVVELKRHRAKIYLNDGDVVLADVPVRSLERLAGESFVLSVAATKAAHVPPFPDAARSPAFATPRDLGAPGPAREVPVVKTAPERFHSELTGKGVIIGVVDTGIDWRHEDFIKPDGTSRILYLWDMTDDSFQTSGGKTGTRPPVLQAGGDPGPGTLYTNEQLNDALGGRGTVNSRDNFGHGTAVAGTAAGNGRATANGVPAGTHKGVAPEVDLIIVKAGDCGSFDATYPLGTYFIAQVAKQRGQPVVINHSFGGHFSAHDGSEPAERLMNSVAGAGRPGVVLTVAAGNEGRYSLHGSGRFGPRRKDQADIEGMPLEVAVSPQRTNRHTWLNGYFDKRDDWGLVVRGSGNFLVDNLGRPFNLYVYKVGGKVNVQLQEGFKEPDYFKELAALILDKTRLAGPEEKLDRLWVPLPPGNYFVWGFGATANVQNGSFDLYMPFYTQGSFTIGAEKRSMVGSPGNAAGVITVGSYDFRAAWENQQGGQTSYSFPLEAISDYSSPGGRQTANVFKPEIAAPARYTLSSMSAAADPDSHACGGENMGASAGWAAVTRDGKHIAWSGTSAAAPYAAGVIALMFQKNPTLDAVQVKEILVRTARRDDRFVGSVPNAEWGYGRLDPTAALAATPRPSAPTKPRASRRGPKQ